MATKKATKPKNEVATTPKGGAVQAHVPDFMKKYAGQGVEKLGNEDVAIPRIILLQGLSDQVKDGDEKAGTWWHNIAEEALSNTLKIIPIYVDIRYILWKPRHEGGGILARADDGVHWNPPNAEFVVSPYKDQPKKKVTWKTAKTVAESGLASWGSSDPDDENSQPAATKMYNVVCMLPDHPELSPCLLTLQRGAVTVAKKLMGKIKITGAPSFGQIFEMGASSIDTGAGPFYAPSFERVGLVEDEDEFLTYKQMYDSFSKAGIHIKDIDSLQEEGGVDEVDEPKGGPKL